MPRPAVDVIGPGDASIEATAAAYEIGRLIGRRGAVLVTGGLSGVMEAASRGARETGGLVVGILPGRDRAAANEAVEIAIPTGMGERRNGLVVARGSAVIAVMGEWGTLSEIGFALKLGIPVIGWKTWELSRGGVVQDGMVRVQTPAQAVDEAFARMR